MQYYILASTYGSGTYNTDVYNGSTSTGTSTGTGSSSGGGVLTNTGFDIALAVTVACVIVFAALVVRFWKRPRKNQVAAEEVTTEE
jgi:hypothetical protein